MCGFSGNICGCDIANGYYFQFLKIETILRQIITRAVDTVEVLIVIALGEIAFYLKTLNLTLQSLRHSNRLTDTQVQELYCAFSSLATAQDLIENKSSKFLICKILQRLLYILAFCVDQFHTIVYLKFSPEVLVTLVLILDNFFRFFLPHGPSEQIRRTQGIAG